MEVFRSIPVSSVEGYEINQQLISKPLNLSSSALEVMANFSRHTALMLDEDTSVQQATELLVSVHMSKALVKDHQDHFIGIVTLADLQSVKVLSKANQLGVSRADLTVTHLMQPKSACLGISLEVVSRACIGEVLMTMQEQAVNYMMVMSHDNKELVGMISTIDIAKTLHIPIQITPKPKTFSEVVLAVAHP